MSGTFKNVCREYPLNPPRDGEIKWMEQAIDTKGVEIMARKSNEVRTIRSRRVKKNKKQFYTKDYPKDSRIP